jgi:hypothetical protein
VARPDPGTRSGGPTRAYPYVVLVVFTRSLQRSTSGLAHHCRP